MKEIIQKDSDHIPDVGEKVTVQYMKRWLLIAVRLLTAQK